MATEEKAAAAPAPVALQLRFPIPPTQEELVQQIAAAAEAGDEYKEKVLKTVEAARMIAQRGKGILAADESSGTIKKRFDAINVEVGEGYGANHHVYRQLLFQTEGMEEYISGVIMFEETLNNGFIGADPNGQRFVDYLGSRGILVGIKVDKGAKQDLPQVPGAAYVKGLDSLPAMCQKSYALGARFAKWRATLKIQDGYISQASIQETAWTLARYASICQVNGLAPIVEPEILMDGTHSLSVNQYWTEKTLSACYKALIDQEVVLEGTLLKPNMVLPGKQYEGPEVTDNAATNDANFALATVTALKRTVPASVPGIVFLSGGQSEEEATRRLNQINNLGPLPWNASFSYGRALQKSCLTAWQGEAANAAAAQAQFKARAAANSAAQMGTYPTEPGKTAEFYKSMGIEGGNTVAAGADSHINNYTY